MRRIPWTTTPSGGSLRASCRSTARLRAADVLDVFKFLSHLAFAGTIFRCSVALTYVMTRFVRVMDMPNPRSSHTRPVPKSGGIAIVATFVIGSVVIYFSAEIARIDDRYFWGYVISAVLLALVSFVDDVTQKTFLAKIFTQVLCVSVVLASGVTITRLAIPYWGDVGSAFLGFTFSTLAVIGASLDLGHLSFYIVPMLLFHFIFDTVFTFSRRLLRGERVYLPHRAHLYQLLNRLGYSHRAVSLFHYALTVVQGLAAFVSIGLPAERRLLVFIPFLIFEVAYARWGLGRAKAMQLS